MMTPGCSYGDILWRVLKNWSDIITVYVKWGHNEYDNFIINKNYNAGLFIKFEGDPVFDEHVNTIFKLIIKTDVGEIASIITTNSVKRLDIKIGDSLTAMIKTNELMLSKW